MAHPWMNKGLPEKHVVVSGFSKREKAVKDVLENEAQAKKLEK